MPARAKRLLKSCCPPFLWEAARRIYRHALPPPAPPPAPGPSRAITTLEELDAELMRADEARAISYDAHLAVLHSFHFQPPAVMPSDPGSPEYLEAQLALYRQIAGRPRYDAATCERTPFEMEKAVARPFPYSTQSSALVGDQLMSMGALFRALDLPAGGRVLEFGPGYGQLTVELALMGYRVTAVDIDPNFVELVRRRCRTLGLEGTELVCSDMVGYRPAQRFDRVVFSACFHHCHDHRAVIRRLDALVADGGAVVFGEEPILDEFPWPWGLRLDGQSLYCIRRNGWLELGFRTDYFEEVLARHGWSVGRLPAPGSPIYRARRSSRRGAISSGKQTADGGILPGERREAPPDTAYRGP